MGRHGIDGKIGCLIFPSVSSVLSVPFLTHPTHPASRRLDLSRLGNKKEKRSQNEVDE
jgi:hypothetical protein